MTDKIVNLVGASGSGKTTIAKELEREGFNIIQSYTTREPRCENEWGHIFIDYTEVYEIMCGDIVMAYKALHGNEYFMLAGQYQDKGTSIYIVDPDGAEQVKGNIKDVEVVDVEVVTIYLGADLDVRAKRVIDREYDNRGFGNYIKDDQINEYLGIKEEVRKVTNERLTRDSEIFKVVKCDYTVDANRELEEVLEDVIRIIENV